MMSSKFLPYSNSKLNKLDLLSTNTCSLSIILGIFIYKNEFNGLMIIGYLFLCKMIVLFQFIILF